MIKFGIAGLLIFFLNFPCYADSITNEGQHILRHKASRGITDVTNFNNNLSASDTDIQKSLDTIDNLTISNESTTVSDTTTINLTLTGSNITADGLYTAGDDITLTGADFDVDATITRDTEWDTLAEINTASTDADILIFQNLAVTGQTTVATDAVADTLTLAGGGITAITTNATTDTITFTSTEVDGSTTNEINTITLPDANVTAGLGITFAQAGIMAITESVADTVLFTVTEVDGSTTNELPLAGNLTDISGAGSNVVDVDLTEAESVTWGAGAAATIVHTYNVSGTDTTMTMGSAATTFSGTVAGSNLSGSNTGDQTITLTGDVTGTGTGSFAATIAADSVALTTDTSGNYVKDVADGTGIDGTAAGEGATYTPTLDLTEINSATFGSGTFTTLTFDAGVSDPVLTFGSGTLAVTGTLTATNLSGTNTGDNTVATTGDSATSFFSSGTLEVAIGGTGTTTSTGTGSVMLGTSPTITTSLIISNAATVGQAAGPLLTFDDTANELEISGGNVGIGTTGPLALLEVSGGASAGVIAIREASGSGTNNATFTVPALAADTDYTLPTTDGDASQFLQTDGAGVLSWAAGGSGAPTAATYITQTLHADLSAEQALGALATGILKSTTTTGVVSIAAAGTDYQAALTNPMVYGDTRFKVGYFDRDLSTATGTQAITGVGFQPAFVMVSNGTNTAYANIMLGAGDATAQMGIFSYGLSVANSYTRTETNFGRVYDAGGDNGEYQTMDLSSLDADGFTISWTKTGLPTGTAYVMYVAFR